jgi:hypothetical protein
MVKDTISRRNAMKSAGVGVGILGGISTLIPTVVADTESETHEASDSSESSWGNQTIDVGTCVTEYEARAESGGGNDYWVMKFESVTNAQGRLKGDDERWDGVERTRCELDSSTEHWRWRTNNDSKYWIGGGEWNEDETIDDYQNHALKAGQNAAGLIPLVGNALSAGAMIYHLIASVTSYASGPDPNIYEREWDWGPSWDNRGSTKQAEVYNRFECDLDPGQRAGCTVREGASGVHNSDILGPQNEIIINFQAPYTTPSSLESLSATQMEQNGIKEVPAKRIKQNPSKYGETPRYAAQLDNDEVVYYSSMDSEVEINPQK